MICSGFASCSNLRTTSRSRLLRKMGQMGQLMHHEVVAGDVAGARGAFDARPS